MTKFVKPILSIFLVTILIFQYYIFINSDNNSLVVFNEENQNINTYSDYLIDFNDIITTKNIFEKIPLLKSDKLEIKKLYLKTNTLWSQKVKETLNEYSYDNLKKFTKYYKNILINNNLSDEIPNVDIYGIVIDKLLIYTSRENIELFSKKYDIKYEKK